MSAEQHSISASTHGTKRTAEDAGVTTCRCGTGDDEKLVEANKEARPEPGMDEDTDVEVDDAAAGAIEDASVVARIRRLEQVNAEFARSFIALLDVLDADCPERDRSLGLANGIFDGMLASFIQAGTELDNITERLRVRPPDVVPVEVQAIQTESPPVKRVDVDPHYYYRSYGSVYSG